MRHLFSVAAGLDSLMLGEPQILGQLKDAYRVAQRRARPGAELNRLFQTTFAVAKRVRTETGDRRERGLGRLRVASSSRAASSRASSATRRSSSAPAR